MHGLDASLETIYRERAAALARPPAHEGAGRGRSRMIALQVGGETYGLPLGTIERIYAKPVCTPVPGAGPRWAGVCSIQGEIIPALHLSRLLGLSEGSPSADEFLLTLRGGGRRLGLLVAGTLDICELPEDLQPPGAQAQYVTGVTPDNTLVLDPDLLTEQEFLR